MQTQKKAEKSPPKTRKRARLLRLLRLKPLPQLIPVNCAGCGKSAVLKMQRVVFVSTAGSPSALISAFPSMASWFISLPPNWSMLLGMFTVDNQPVFRCPRCMNGQTGRRQAGKLKVMASFEGDQWMCTPPKAHPRKVARTA